MKIERLKDCKWGEKVEIPLMINKVLVGRGLLTSIYAGDKDMEIKCFIKTDGVKLEVGKVILAKGNFSEPFKPSSFQFVEEYDINEFLPSVQRPIEDIMKEIELLSMEEIVSSEAKQLDNYFFSNEHFVEKFKCGIGGVFNHHNYRGGLAEHTLGVMTLSKYLAYKYDIRYKEIAILGAKIHDIGKVYEMVYDAPFSYTLKGSLQGHIVMGIVMVEKAFAENPDAYSEEFKERIKAIIVEHHGKVEYGSPVAPKTQEAHVVHYADYVDANMNKLAIVSEGVEPGTWSGFDKRVDGKLFL
ncbi:HD domain-containing protein [Clostridium vincentii]|uniref:3'-5' exoribonuclease YhaM n=1 Tax=Clostridium vincentii TaxID=52704 RepID=A0A2T0BEB2_9CLOT|nr:HD domain-containing protein [Clostridium vincentii]PRR82240.1 3'-5' exoribonuclease YhaM [Clostridium vincentii]